MSKLTHPVFIKCIKHKTRKHRSITIRKPLLIHITEHLQISFIVYYAKGSI